MTVASGTVAVTIQRATPTDVAALVFHAHGLTARERQLARLLLDGLPNTEIAQQLYISTYTVRDHVKAVLDKLGVHNQTRTYRQHSQPAPVDVGPAARRSFAAAWPHFDDVSA
jgi:DNA-binding NarL/FixJ family response regulator